MLGRSSRRAGLDSGREGDNETYEPLLGTWNGSADHDGDGGTTIFALEDEDDDGEEGLRYGGGYSDHPVDGRAESAQSPNGRVHGVALKSTMQSREAGTWAFIITTNLFN